MNKALKKHPLWPAKYRHPATKERFVNGSVTSVIDVLELRYGPPSMPTKAVFDIDENTDELVYVRELSDEEMRAEMLAYSKAAEEWSANQGVRRVPGRTNITGSFVTKSGAEVCGMYDGDSKGGKWLWTSYSVTDY
jgi:hypothetical protein